MSSVFTPPPTRLLAVIARDAPVCGRVPARSRSQLRVECVSALAKLAGDDSIHSKTTPPQNPVAPSLRRLTKPEKVFSQSRYPADIRKS